MKKVILAALIVLLAGSAVALEYVGLKHEYLVTTRSIPADSTGNDSLYYDTARMYFDAEGGLVKVKYRYKVDSVFTGDTIAMIWRTYPHWNYVNPDDTLFTDFATYLVGDTITGASTSWTYDSLVFATDTLGYHRYEILFISIDSLVTTTADTLSGNSYIDSAEFLIEEWK